jgi:hypothetical protein
MEEMRLITGKSELEMKQVFRKAKNAVEVLVGLVPDKKLATEVG